MRIPSRHMPRYKPSPAPPLAWLMAAGLLIGCGYGLYGVLTSSPQMVLAAVSVMLVLLLFAHLQGKRNLGRLRALASSRSGQSICEFARDFERHSVDAWIVRAVYEQLQSQLAHMHPQYPVRADDRLNEDLLLDDDDLDMNVALQVGQRTGRSLANTEINPMFGKVKTVRDLVMFFQAQPRRENAI